MLAFIKRASNLQLSTIVIVINLMVGFMFLFSTANFRQEKQCPSGIVNHYKSQDFRGRQISGWQSNTTIFVITPTHTRAVQKAELTRLGQTLMNVPNLHWILVENGPDFTSLVKNVVKNLNLRVTHLYAPDTDPTLGKGGYVPRGVAPRNAGIKWLRSQFTKAFLKNNSAKIPNGVVYFADDDNTYDIRLFEKMRKIRKVGVCPVGLLGGLYVEKPELNSKNKVIGFDIEYMRGERKFGLDMAGFAINLKELLEHRKPHFIMEHPPEEKFLVQFGYELIDLEPFAMDINEVLVWHTQTKMPKFGGEAAYKKRMHFNSNHNVFS